MNLTGTFLVIQAAAPLIQQAGKGTIVNIASGIGLMPTGPVSVAYVASKGGGVALTKSVAMEPAPNIRVNSVCPGAVETAMTAGYIRTAAGDPNPAITCAPRYVPRLDRYPGLRWVPAESLTSSAPGGLAPGGVR